MIAKPYFTIVMPVFNRPVSVRRAIDSCLAQDFASFEVVVVDDGSGDGTAEAVAGYDDPRVRLILHRTNRGVCPARNTAIRASRGQWLIFLDSDHEMLPGCLSSICRHIAEGGPICRYGFQYLFDDGRVSPDPMPPESLLGYTEWLRWIDYAPWTDALWATRRDCFEHCLLPESFALEFSYFLNFARHFQSRMVALALAFQHTDSPDRLSYMAPPANPEMVKRKAQDQAADWQSVLADHGDSLRKLAPRCYEAILRNAALANLSAGNRPQAWRTILAALLFRPGSPRAWATLLAVLAGPWAALALAKLRSEHRRRSKRFPRADASLDDFSGEVRLQIARN